LATQAAILKAMRHCPYRCRSEVRLFGTMGARSVPGNAEVGRVLARIEEHRPSANADALRADTGGAYTRTVALTTETDFSDPEPGRIAAAINDLLIRYGYPAERVDSWWNDSAYEALGGRTPTAAWLSGDYRSVWNLLRAAYAASEDAAKRLASDSSHAAMIERRIAELEQRYGP
jgi:hypothetical protein